MYNCLKLLFGLSKLGAEIVGIIFCDHGIAGFKRDCRIQEVPFILSQLENKLKMESTFTIVLTKTKIYSLSLWTL